MSSHRSGGAATSTRQRAEAASRSAALIDLFDRLSSADARAWRRSSLDSVDGSGSYAACPSLPQQTRGRGGGHNRRGPAASVHPVKYAVSSPQYSLTAAAPSSSPRPLNASVLLRNGRTVALSPRSRRLPPVFYEQAQVLGSVGATTTEVQRTLQELHRDLAVHSRGHSKSTRANLRSHRHDSGGDPVSPSGSSQNSEGGFYGPSKTTGAVQRRLAAEEARVEKLRIHRARAAAADEGASDDQSVEDYGVDCEIPPLTGESRLEDVVAAVAAHFAKAKASALVMAEIEELAPTTSAAPWWSSALRLRGMKAAAARLDYHAHAALGWSYRAREQLLLQVAHLNTVAASTHSQLLQQQHHWQEFQTRLKDGQQAVAQAQTSIALWQAQAQEEARHRVQLQEELLQYAHATGVVDAAETNHLKAELALLLTERGWPSRSLQRDAQTVLAWLQSVSTPLE